MVVYVFTRNILFVSGALKKDDFKQQKQKLHFLTRKMMMMNEL